MEAKQNGQPFVPDPGNAGVGKRTVQTHLDFGRFCGHSCFHTPSILQTLHDMGTSMEITVNGELKTVDRISMLSLLESLGIDSRRVAVELNLDILPKGEYGTTMLNDGDRIEVVQFVGGG